MQFTLKGENPTHSVWLYLLQCRWCTGAHCQWQVGHCLTMYFLLDNSIFYLNQPNDSNWQQIGDKALTSGQQPGFMSISWQRSLIARDFFPNHTFSPSNYCPLVLFLRKQSLVPSCALFTTEGRTVKIWVYTLISSHPVCSQWVIWS